MKKDTLKLIIVGHIDHGKSTVIGRLLLATNSLPKETLAEIKKISHAFGKETELAYLADQLEEERTRNITIDTTQLFFKTRKRNYVIIDAPGHVEFLKNMLTGASLAEAALLIIDVTQGMQEQTRRHAYLLNLLGIKNIIVVFNKMDLINYEQGHFEKIGKEMVCFLKSLSLTPIHIIPVSAKIGDTVAYNSVHMPWYKGPSLLKSLDMLSIRTTNTNKPLRLSVQDVYNTPCGKIIAGKISSGTLKKNDRITILPARINTCIQTIKTRTGNKSCVTSGENIGLLLKNTPPIQRGDIIVHTKNQPAVTQRFEGHIFWMAQEPLHINHSITIQCATQTIQCVAERIIKKINSSTLEMLEENAQTLEMHEAGVIIFKTEKPVIVDQFSFIEDFGRFIVAQHHVLHGAGIITRESA